jgi:quercetin 2,3-dioxygenase
MEKLIMERTIKNIFIGQPSVDGAGVNLIRILNNKTVTDFDPFLMLDAFDSTNPADYEKGFPWHPHRGMETITYLMSGKIEHGDSLGNEGAILDGSCQWMTSGSGIMHWEMPKASKRFLGVQLWLNLPKTDKFTSPKYRAIESSDIPEIIDKNSKVRVISGTYNDIEGPVSGDFVKLTFLDIKIEPNSNLSISTSFLNNLFVYIYDGEANFGANISSRHRAGRVLLFNVGSEISISTSTKSIGFLLFSAKPLNEPIAWGGPIVMNTQEELIEAFKEIKQGTFIK